MNRAVLRKNCASYRPLPADRIIRYCTLRQVTMADQLKVPLYDAEKSAPASVVCVTGATGFMAGPIVQRLLAAGHTVHATCRDPSNAKSVAHLKAMPGATERLKLFKADLLEVGSFEAALEGCDYVVHTASPFIADASPSEAKAKLIDPAVKGTENILNSVNKCATVKRVALTSSAAAVYGNPEERGKGHVFTEADWNLTASESVLPYYASKKLAEERAWEMVKQQSRWQLVVINPAVIMGPPPSDRAPGESVTLMKQVWNGDMYPACPVIGFGIVDARDVAAAHCLALFHPKANGRNLCLNSSLVLSDICKMVAELYPNKVKAPLMTLPKWLVWLLAPYALGVTRSFVTHSVGFMPQFDTSKITNELGMKFIDVKETLKDMVEGMAELGLIKKPGQEQHKAAQK